MIASMMTGMLARGYEAAGWAGLMLAQADAVDGGPLVEPVPPSNTPIIFFAVAMFAGAYFLFFRPQNKEKKTRENMLGDMKKGDEVITIGGIHGKVSGVDAAWQRMSSSRRSRSAVSSRLSA